MARLYDLARMTTATTGTGTITLGSAVASFLTFAQAGVANGDTVTYAIEDGANREIGRGVYTSSGTTLTRATILRSTNSNAAISLSGTAQVFIAAAAEDISPQTAAEQSTVRMNLYAAPYDVMAKINAIVNGSMELTQQYGSAGGPASLTSADNSANTYNVDQWFTYKVSSGTWTVSQQSDGPPTFPLCLDYLSPTTQTLSSGDLHTICQAIEGFRMVRFAFGSSSAARVTFGFWVKATQTGTMTVGFCNAKNPVAGTSIYRHNITINAANTWEYKTITLDGDTAHTWATNTNAGLCIFFVMAAGSSQKNSTVDAWDATNPTIPASSSQTNFLASANDRVRFSATWFVATGDTPSAAQSTLFHSTQDEELDVCQRYYEHSYQPSSPVGTVTDPGAVDCGFTLSSGATFAASAQQGTVFYKRVKRGTPTITFYSPATGTSGKIRDAVAGVDVTGATANINRRSFAWSYTPNAAAAQTRAQFHWAADSRII